MKISVLLALTLLTSLCSCRTDKEDGDSDGVDTTACGVIGLDERVAYPRIINGTECSEVDSPVVQLTMLFNEGLIGSCSGTLISADAILTAAHCFSVDDEPCLSVSARVEGRDKEVSKVVLHPEADVPQNDVAIVFLSKSVSTPTLPLALSAPMQPKDIISVFGFGVDQDQIGGVLRSGQMRVVGLNSQNIQAKFQEKNSNVCYGDSGGPAVLTFKNEGGDEVSGIVGITSFGNSSGCSVGESVFFANVQNVSISDFIKREVPQVKIE
ncbi:MAG: trypsin-like serine protease [Deltaproteobacteria bacterium]|nr:trypsin-like serine protease [Deltaproteobacteria bacterium]